jgi:acetylornithine deacetylase/succinyl-diaminopimelate desuccinylase-like protein
MSSPFVLRVHGRSGHASLPSIADNALVKAAGLIERLAELDPEPELIPEVAAFLEVVCGSVPAPGDALVAARAVDSAAAVMIEALLSFTVSPTMITASHKRNVIPALTEVTVDCRLLPGQTQAAVEPGLRAWLGDGDYEIVWREGQGGTRSVMETPLWSAAESFVAQVEPGARVAPICVAGFTDSHWLREAFDTVAYGFFPARELPAEVAATLIHSADERVPVADLELGVDWLRFAARALLS